MDKILKKSVACYKVNIWFWATAWCALPCFPIHGTYCLARLQNTLLTCEPLSYNSSSPESRAAVAVLPQHCWKGFDAPGYSFQKLLVILESQGFTCCMRYTAACFQRCEYPKRDGFMVSAYSHFCHRILLFSLSV